MVRIKNFFNWLLMGSAMTSGSRNFEIAARGASLSFPNKPVYPTRVAHFDGDGGTVVTEQAGVTETPEERSRRLKRERDRRYKANKKAKLGQLAVA